MEAVTIILRPYQPDDAPFLFSTWRNSSFYGSKELHGEERMQKEWFREKTRSIRHVLGSAIVKVAVLSDDPTQIVGYSVLEGKHLHWVYVKADYRRQGVARLLVPAWIETVTGELTKIGKSIAEAKGLVVKGEQEDGSSKEG